MQIHWQDPFCSYARKWINNNYWRVRHIMTMEDAYQQCALTFVECRNRYAEKVDNPAWFMALYKRGLWMDWNTLSIKDTRYAPSMIPMSDDLELMRENMADPPYSTLIECWLSASHELRQVIHTIANGSQGLLDLMLSDDTEANMNARLRRISGIKGDADIIGELRQLLT